MQAHFWPSQRGGNLLLDPEGYAYANTRDYGKGTRAHYRCIKRKTLNCPASAVLDTENNFIVKVKYINSLDLYFVKVTHRMIICPDF